MRSGAGQNHSARKGKKRRGRFTLCLLLLLLGVSFLVYRVLNPPLHLVVAAPRQNEVIYRLPVQAGQEFALEYTHSVTGRPVRGTFLLTAGKKIKPLTTRFDAFGPGLPHLDGSLEYTVDDQGFFVVYHQEEPREHIRLFVSPLTGEVLLLSGRSYDLGRLGPAPLLLEISLK